MEPQYEVRTGISPEQWVGNFSSKLQAREARKQLQFILSVKFPVSDQSPTQGTENCPKLKKTMIGL